MDVLLTTRDRRLRSHGGETAFPGGKADEGDGGCWIWTAVSGLVVKREDRRLISIESRTSTHSTGRPTKKRHCPSRFHLMYIRHTGSLISVVVRRDLRLQALRIPTKGFRQRKSSLHSVSYHLNHSDL